MKAFTREIGGTRGDKDAREGTTGDSATNALSGIAAMESTRPAATQTDESTPRSPSTSISAVHAPHSAVTSDVADASQTPPHSPTKTLTPSTPQTPSRSPRKLDRDQSGTGTPLRRRFLRDVAMSPHLSSAPCTPPRSPTRTPSPSKRGSPSKSPEKSPEKSPVKSSAKTPASSPSKSLSKRSLKSPAKTPASSPRKIETISGPNGTLEIGASAFYFSCELPARKIVPSPSRGRTPKKSGAVDAVEKKMSDGAKDKDNDAVQGDKRDKNSSPDIEDKENAGQETVLRLNGRNGACATRVLGRTRTPSPDVRGERKQSQTRGSVLLTLTSKEKKETRREEKETNIGHLMAGLGKTTPGAAQGPRKNVVTLDSEGVTVGKMEQKSEPPTPLRAAARSLVSTEYRVMPVEVKAEEIKKDKEVEIAFLTQSSAEASKSENRLMTMETKADSKKGQDLQNAAQTESKKEEDLENVAQAQTLPGVIKSKPTATKQVVTRLPKPRRVGTDPDLRAAMRREMEHVEESLSRSTGLGVSFQSNGDESKRKDSLDMLDMPDAVQTTTKAHNNAMRRSSLPRLQIANKPAAPKSKPGQLGVRGPTVKATTKTAITSTRKTSLPQLRSSNNTTLKASKPVPGRDGAITPDASKSSPVRSFLKKGSGSVNRYSPGRTPVTRQQEKPNPLQSPTKKVIAPLTQSPSSGNKGRTLARSPTRRGFRTPAIKPPVNGTPPQKSGLKSAEPQSQLKNPPLRHKPDLHTPLKPGPVARNDRQQNSDVEVVSAAEIADRITKWNGGGIKEARSKARIESSKSGPSSKATSPSKTPFCASPVKTKTTSQPPGEPSFTPPGSPEKMSTSPPTTASSKTTSPSDTPRKNQHKPTNAFLARLASPKHPPPTPKAKQALPLPHTTPKPAPSAVQRLRAQATPATPTTPGTLPRGKSRIAVLDRGALRTPSKAVAEALDRAIDAKIEEERGRFGVLDEE